MNALLQWLTEPEWSQVVKTLLHSLWQGVLIAVALALAMRRVGNPHWRYRLSLLALAAIPVAGIITWATLNTSNRPLPIATPAPVTIEAAAPTITLNQNPDTKVVVVVNHSPAPPPVRWTAWLALLWIIGTGAMLGRAGIKLAGAEQLRRSCQPLESAQVTQLLVEARRAVGLARQIRVAVTDKLTSPAVVGVIVPTLILPLSTVTMLSPEQIHFILLHELAHIRRGDYFANLFQLFVEALLFFNPAVWLISHQVRREREACCDALAIELSGAPADYARTLVHVAENVLSPMPASATAFGGDREPSSLADRVQRLLVPGYRPSLRLTWRAMIAAFVLGAVMLVLSAEGTRVAVAELTKSPTQSTDQKKTSSQENKPKLETASHSSENLNAFKPTSWPLDSDRGTLSGPENPGGMTDWDMNVGNVLPLPALRLNRVTSIANGDKVPLLGDLPWVGKLFASSQAKSLATDFVQLSQLSSQNKEIRSEHHITDNLSIHFQDTVAGSDLVLARLPRDGAQLAAKPPNQVEAVERFSIGDFITVNFASTIDKIPQHKERIKRDGTITLPLIGVVTAAGKAAAELQKEIYNSYVPAYYKQLTVIVTGEESVSYVGGSVPVGQVPRGATSPTKASQSAGRSDQSADQRAGGGLSHPSKTNPSPIEISGSTELSQVYYDIAEGKTVVTNGGVIRFNELTIRADSIQVNQKTGNLVASGNVRVERPGLTSNSARVELNIYSNLPPVQASNYRITVTAEKRAIIAAKLKQITLERVDFDALPLSRVVLAVDDEARQRDPERRGVRIIINPNVASPEPGPAIDVGDIRITVNPPLTNVSLEDALNAIVKGASRPLKFSLEEYAVVISIKGQETTPFFMREFNLNLAVFTNRLAQKGYTFDNPPNVTNTASAIRKFFADAGIDLQPTNGHSVFYHDRRGILLVRATKEKLDRVEQLVVELNRPEPRINIKTRFVEVSPSELETFLPDLMSTMKAANSQSWSGILTKPQVNQVWQYLQTGKSVNLLSEGEVTTLSGRQAQIQQVEIKTIVTDINPKALVPPGIISTNKYGSGESLFITTTNLPFGQVIDIVPAITPDGYNVALTMIPRMTEFLGYDGIEHPTNTVVVYENGKKGKATYPLPRLRTQQMTNSAVVRDGMTLMLAFPPVQKTITTRDKVPVLGDIPGVGRFFRTQSSQTRTNILFVLVTPTIVSPTAKQPVTSANDRDGDTESFITSTNLRPVIDYLLR